MVARDSEFVRREVQVESERAAATRRDHNECTLQEVQGKEVMNGGALTLLERRDESDGIPLATKESIIIVTSNDFVAESVGDLLNGSSKSLCLHEALEKSSSNFFDDDVTESTFLGDSALGTNSEEDPVITSQESFSTIASSTKKKKKSSKKEPARDGKPKSSSSKKKDDKSKKDSHQRKTQTSNSTRQHSKPLQNKQRSVSFRADFSSKFLPDIDMMISTESAPNQSSRKLVAQIFMKQQRERVMEELKNIKLEWVLLQLEERRSTIAKQREERNLELQSYRDKVDVIREQFRDKMEDDYFEWKARRKSIA